MKIMFNNKLILIVSIITFILVFANFVLAAKQAIQTVTVTVLPEEGTGISSGVNINASQQGACHKPEIFIDHTARGWYPNDQTYYTANLYGEIDYGGKCNLGSEYDRYEVSQRMDYAFTGETIDYLVLVRDIDGADDIGVGDVRLTIQNATINPVEVGACADVTKQIFMQTASPCPDSLAFGTVFNSTTDKIFVCKLIIQDSWNSEMEVSINAKDGNSIIDKCIPQKADLNEVDYVNFNPTLEIILDGGRIDFGSVTAGSVATSNTVRLRNNAEIGSGVMMDMYIASDDYFTSSNPNAICPTGNGIKYDKFSYYATKGSLNSGSNNNAYPGLGKKSIENYNCRAKSDEFTQLTSNSGNIKDMCRIINTAKDSSLLSQGAEMSLTFRLNVPSVCQGNFNNGQFHFVGRVI